MQAPKDLITLQEAFESFVNLDEPKDLDPLIVDLSKIAKNKSLEIYRSNYLSSLIDSLSDTYSACKKLLGEEVFQSICLAYIKQESSKSSLLSDFGENFSHFIEKSSLAQEIPFTSDLVSYEWKLKEVILNEFDTEDSKSVNNSFDSKDTLCLKNHALLFQSNFPISEIWQSLTNEDVSLPEGDAFYYLIIKVNQGSKTVSISEQLYNSFENNMMTKKKSEYIDSLKILNILKKG